MLVDLHPFTLQGIDRSFHIDGIPQRDSSRQQRQSTGAVALIFRFSVPDFTQPVQEYRTRQRVTGFSFTGPSGLGKTTLMKILAGLLKPTAGEVCVNGINIAPVPGSWRACIACVLQDDTLFAGSVAENICATDGEPDTAHMEACARRCCIHEDIQRMPMGYQTLISELGGSLSGGQKQRLLIARALYRRPAVLFLDEATSHLDAENESRINAAIQALNITRVIIAHRPSTIASADRIISLTAEGAGEVLSDERNMFS